MKIFLDTNALLWAFSAPEKLTPKARKAFLEAEGVFYSVITLWEIGLKMSRGGFRDIEVPEDWQVSLIAELETQLFTMLPVVLVHCRMIQDLVFHHKDPFDRMVIAQALERELAVVGSDEEFEKYGVERIW